MEQVRQKLRHSHAIDLREVQQFNDKYFGEFWEVNQAKTKRAERIFLNALYSVKRAR